MMNKKNYEKYKKNVENDLRNYPYWLLAIETPGLGSPNRWGEINQNKYNHTSTVEEDMLRDMEKSWKVDVITKVLGQLDPTSKKIIEEWYFRDIMTREQIQESLNLDKNKFYYYRNRTLKKFMAALNYI
ncbi:nitroreductase [Clostridium botulinum]|uniref:nitroreductase n=1 Tax=Clostridium botulinum TaxID=1491 RepID=UPI00137623A3|nr:nitroreductase [Clostridium botulinum]MCJ8173962.1 nitroreductase [Clostridium botulinum]NCI22017.1 nitroreductase [Clostridium botulinum]NCI37733.1 nitroreductase [Clostridium botulinum]NCI74342.1 nitroreductase [Clostridium botulinum]NDI40592.1 nitroreductase [Clostridium botulinum]